MIDHPQLGMRYELMVYALVFFAFMTIVMIALGLAIAGHDTDKARLRDRDDLANPWEK